MKVMVGAVGQRGTVYPQSPCERDSGVSVFGLARVSSISHSLPHSLSRSLSQELLLIKPVCFGRHTVALSSSTLARMSARRRTCITDTRAHPAFVCFGSDQVPLTRASKRQRSAEHTTVFTFAERGHHPPPPRAYTRLTELTVWVSPPHKHNLTLAITPAVLDINCSMLNII